MSLEVDFKDGARRFRFGFRPAMVPIATDGLFTPESVIRRVYSDSVCLMGAATALLLQLSHPLIAQGVHDHSNFQGRPLDRLLGTLHAMNTVVFGSVRDAEAIRMDMERVHRGVTGPGYRALDADLLCWVNATLLGTSIEMYQRVIGKLSITELDELVHDSRRVGEVFGCPLAEQPGTWLEFHDYWNETVASLVVNDAARAVAQSLMRGQGLPLRHAWLPALSLSRSVTAATLPECLRQEFDLPWRRQDQLGAELVFWMSRTVMGRVPARWRQLGPEFLRSSSTGSHPRSDVAA